MNFTTAFALAALLLATSVLAQGDATLLADEAMLVQPARSSAFVARLKAGMRVELIEQKAGWARVDAAGLQGWVRRIALRAQPNDAGLQYQDVIYPRAAPVLVAGIRKVDETPSLLKVVSVAMLCDLPGDCEPPLGKLSVGTQVSLVLQDNGWVLVDVDQPARQGWLPLASVCLATPTLAATLPACSKPPR